MTEKAPSLHAELQNQLAAQQRAQEAAQQYQREQTIGGGSSSGGGKEGGEQADPDEFYYSMLGWGTFTRCGELVGDDERASVPARRRKKRDFLCTRRERAHKSHQKSNCTL